jgi:hypothetical protein
MVELVWRVLVGGVLVSFFAMPGDVLRPKSFAGLFSAAPSVALPTIGLTIHTNGKGFAAQEATTMPPGSAAFLLYAVLVSFVLRRYRPSALKATIALLPLWFAAALGSWLMLAGRW